MREWIKPALIVIVVVAIAGVAVHDVGAVVFQGLRAQDVNEKIVEEAVRGYQTSTTGDEKAAYYAATVAAASNDATITGWLVKDNKVRVWISLRPRKTLVLEPILTWLAPRFPQLHKTLWSVTNVTSDFSDSLR